MRSKDPSIPLDIAVVKRGKSIGFELVYSKKKDIIFLHRKRTTARLASLDSPKALRVDGRNGNPASAGLRAQPSELNGPRN